MRTVWHYFGNCAAFPAHVSPLEDQISRSAANRLTVGSEDALHGGKSWDLSAKDVCCRSC